MDAVTLRRAYRDHLLAGLDRLREKNQLKLEEEFQYLREDHEWGAFLRKLASTEWVSYIEPPARQANGKACPAEQVVKYLSRYLTGGPISDARVIAADESEVTFWAREGKTPGGDDHCIPITLSTCEFTRRWSLHILPKGYTKTRRFGGWSNRRRETYLERCAILLEATSIPLSPHAIEFSPELLQEDDSGDGQCEDDEACPLCGRPMRLLNRVDKPSWLDILTSAYRPRWYGHDSL